MKLLAQQGQGEAARQTVTEAAAKLHALGMHWHAEQAIRVRNRRRRSADMEFVLELLGDHLCQHVEAVLVRMEFVGP